MITAVDTNLLVDVLAPHSVHAGLAEEKIARAERQGALVMSEPVFAELAALFSSQQEMSSFLRDMHVHLVPSTEQILHRAGVAWRAYSKRRRASLACPRCGARTDARCPGCGAEILVRQHIVADFIIGAHAETHADGLLTRDRGYYRTYFPKLKLL